MRRRSTTRGSESGFTLLELMTVMGVLAILAGIGIGFLGKSDNSMSVCWAYLRDKIRLAYETARQTGRTTRVEYIQSDEGAHWLRGKVLGAIGQWHLEPDERYYGRMIPTLSGTQDPDGRFGYCYVPDPELDQSMFVLPTNDYARFDLIDGFAFQVELFLESRAECIVATLDNGNTFELRLDADLRPSARMHLSAPGGQRGRSVELEAKDEALPLRRWVSLEVYFDGREFGIAVDDLEVARVAAVGEPYQNRQDTGILEVSPRGSHVPGKIDEIVMLAYQRGEDSELPPGVDITGLATPIVFDGDGKLQAPVTIELAMDDLKERRTVAPGGVLQ